MLRLRILVGIPFLALGFILAASFGAGGPSLVTGSGAALAQHKELKSPEGGTKDSAKDDKGGDKSDAKDKSKDAAKGKDGDDDDDDDAAANKEAEKNLPPEEKMRRRYPQPVKVGFLIGLPLLDWNDSTIGYVRDVTRTPDGKIKLIVPHGAWLPWFGWGGRPVAIPIETVAILARQIALLDIETDKLKEAPTWAASQGQKINPGDTIQIAVTRR